MKLRLRTLFSGLVIATTILGVSGCKSVDPDVPVASGFLTTYRDMEQLDAVTWMREAPDNRIVRYRRFIINPVKIKVMEFEGESVRPEAAREASAYMRDAIEKAIGDKYPVVNEAAPDVGELRVAITDAYRREGRVGMAMEAELLDSYSGVPIAAVVQAAVDEVWYGKKWAGVPAKKIMDQWAAGFRKSLDAAQAE